MDIKQIKSQLSIIAVLQHYNIKVDKNNQIRCPFHEDKTPSMQVYEDKNMVYCHSSNCKCGGKLIDGIDFIMLYEKFTKYQAILKAQYLIDEINFFDSLLPIKQNDESQQKSIKPIMTEQINYNELFIKLQHCYIRNDKAIAYAKSRNINHAKLQIGFNTPTGTVSKHLKNCIIFPLKNLQNEIVSLYGRSVDDNDKAKHYYTKDRKGLYHNTTKETTTLIITESIIDAATIQVFTNYETLALFGTNGFNDEHKTLLKSLKKLEEIMFFLDGDEAGVIATAKYVTTLNQLLPHITISKVITPDGEDINALTQSHEPAILNHLIDNRIKLIYSQHNDFNSVRESAELISSPENTTTQSQQAFSSEEKKPITSKLDCSNEDYLAFVYENILMSIIGGITTYPIDKLKITLGLQRSDSKNKLHKLRHNFDLYNEDALQRFIRTASEKLELGSKTLQYGIAELIELLEKHRNDKINRDKPPVELKKILSQFKIEELLKILKRPDLIKYLNELIGSTGIVGEEINRLIMWIVFTSRLMENPLHIICLGASGTGKTYLQERVAELFPKEEKISFTASTEQAFYYVGRTELKHKIVLVEDMDGASSVLYVLRELQSKSYVSKLVPIKDSKGNMQTKLLEVEGPIVLSGTTTKEKLYEDNANRCLLIYLDNSNEQQSGIMNRQRNVSAGLVNRAEEQSSIDLLQDIQRMFRPIKIVNPFATKLHIPETVFKPLRTNAHYLQFIEAITFIHQWQRHRHIDKQGVEYIETTLEDIEIANELLKDVLLAKSDELTKACRDFLEDVKDYLKKKNSPSFFKNEVREAFRMNPNTIKKYISQLLQYGYIKIQGGHKNKGYEYEILRGEEYEALKNSINTVFDSILNEIKKGSSGSVDI